MKRGHALKTILLPATVLLLSSCLTIKPVEYKGIENLAAGKNDTAYTLTFGLKMSNPNNWSIRLTKVEADVSINDQLLARSGIDTTVRLTRNSDFTLPVTARVSFSDLLKFSSLGLNLWTGKQSATATLKGTMTLKKFLFRKKFQFEYKEQVDSKKLKSFF